MADSRALRRTLGSDYFYQHYLQVPYFFNINDEVCLMGLGFSGLGFRVYVCCGYCSRECRIFRAAGFEHVNQLGRGSMEL